jgi:hypothetical protein
LIQLLLSVLTHAVALLVYPGLLTMIVAGALIELVWMRLSRRDWEWPELRRRRLTPVVATVALCAVVAAVQLAAPFNPVPGAERSVVLAAIALAFTAWAEFALTIDYVPAPGLLLIAQVSWLLAVLGLAVQTESLRPQVLGNIVVPGLVPVKVACALLYLLCLPALLRLRPFAPQAEKRAHVRLDAGRVLTWLPYCGLFTTLFLPPPGDDLVGVLRFFGVTLAVAAVVIAFGAFLRDRGASGVRALYVRGVAPYAAIVLAMLVATSILMR